MAPLPGVFVILKQSYKHCTTPRTDPAFSDSAANPLEPAVISTYTTVVKWIGFSQMIRPVVRYNTILLSFKQHKRYNNSPALTGAQTFL